MIAFRMSMEFLTLTRVNHQVRGETYETLPRSFHFHNDLGAMRYFCSNANPSLALHITSLHFAFIQDFVTESPDERTTLAPFLAHWLPNLQRLYLTLLPRNPRLWDRLKHQRPSVCQGMEWGPQSILFLSCLVYTSFTVQLSLRWKYNCDFFEHEYVGKRGWFFVKEDRQGTSKA